MFPRWIILFSGKRKSGKDFMTDKLQQILGPEACTIIKISEPIKSHWANALNLNLKELMGDGKYKEKYRLEMIKWSEDMREKDYGCFCKLACEQAKKTQIWIVSDIRRKTDVKWFKETFGERVKTVRICADNSTRIARGWIFTADVDDAPSECDLDDYNNWDFMINNDSIKSDIDDELKPILNILA